MEFFLEESYYIIYTWLNNVLWTETGEIGIEASPALASVALLFPARLSVLKILAVLRASINTIASSSRRLCGWQTCG